MNLVTELRRRNVFKVGIAYLVIAWLLIQIVVAVEAPLYLPDFFDTAVIVLLAIGFPITLVVAWAFELTPEGVKLTKAVDPEASIAPRTGRRLNYLIIGALSLAVAVLVVDNYVLDEVDGTDVGTDDSAEASAANPPPAEPPAGQADVLPNSIAILPFENLSSEANADFAEGVYADIFYELEKLDRLTVIGRRTMRRYENTLKSYEEIAAETRAQTVLELLVRFADNRVRINAELVRVAGTANDVLWTDAYEEDYTTRSFFEIQSDIARNIAERLVGELSPADEARLGQVLTENAEALSDYLKTLPYTDGSYPDNRIGEAADRCLEPITRAVALDPGFKEAWLRKARCHDIRALMSPNAAQEEGRLSIAALEQALAIDDEYADAHAALAFALAYGDAWLEAGRAHRTALDLGAERNPLLLFSMGYLREARDAAQAWFARDPENSLNANFLMVLHESLGDTEGSDRIYRTGLELYEAWNAGGHGRLVALMTRARRAQADPAAVERHFREGQMPPFRAQLAPLFNDREAVVAYLRGAIEAYAGNPFTPTDIATFAAYFEEPEVALQALKGGTSRFAINLAWLWTPLFEDVRRLESFKQHMREIGMVDAWRELGWPDLCEPTGGDDFRCD